MPGREDMRHGYRHLSSLLEYPSPALTARVSSCLDWLESVNSQAAAWLRKFQTHVEQTALTQLEEIYSATFDLQPKCVPYAGYHLFGENYQRGAFMVKLQEQYRCYGFSWGNELPDHIAVILRFMSVLPDPEAARVMREDCLIPVFQKIMAGFAKEDRSIYGPALQTVLVWMQEVSL